MRYDPWEQDILDAKGNVLCNKGRQIGGTETFSHKSGEYMRNNPKHQIICVSDTLDQAENIINMVLAYLHDKCPKDIQRGKHKPTKTRVWLKNGAHIISRPVGNTGDAVRSFTGNILYIDEAALMPRSFWVAALAVLFSTGGKIWVSSTPRGKYEKGKGSRKTYYYEAYLNLRKKWTIIEQTSEWVAYNREICDTWPKERREEAIQFLKDRKEDMSDLEYRREYMGEFTDDNQQWFDDKLIRSRMVATRPNKEDINPDWFVGMGNDIARKGLDDGSYEVFRVSDDRMIQIENQISKDQPITTTRDQIIGLKVKFDIDHIFIDDEGSLGKGVYDLLMENDDTKRITHGITNSKRILDEFGKERGIQKTELYVTLLSMMQKSKIDLLDDESIFQSLKSVQFVYDTDSKGKRHLKIFGHDTHICEGITRACEILKYKELNMKIYSIPI